MDGKKVYQISINGIDQSIKQVDALSDSLQFLDKETKDLQEQRAAAERMAANSYANTMKGMKQELSDIKKVMQTTELGSEKFQEMTARAKELTEGLKKIEEAYGQFGRNVGNYKSAFDEVKKVTVQVGNTAREFNSVRDASRQLTQELKAMAIAGKEDTQEYKDLADAVHNFEMASKRAESAVNDLKASSKGMDDVLDMFESFTALGSIGSGLSAFFGLDDSEIQRSIQKLVALQNVLQGIEKIRQQMNTQEGIGAVFANGSASVDKFVAKLTGAEVTMNGLTKSSKAATVAVRGLSLALKAIGVGLAMEGINMLIQGFERIISSADSTKVATDALTRSLNSLNKQFEAKNNASQVALLNNQITNEEYLARIYQNQNDYLNQSIELLNRRAAIASDRSWYDNLNVNDSNTGYTGQKLTGSTTIGTGHLISFEDFDFSYTVNSIEEAREAFEKLSAAVDEGKDYFDKYGTSVSDWFASLTVTAKNTEEVMKGVGNLIISDYIGRLQEANNRYAQATRDVADGVEGAHDKLNKAKADVKALADEMNNDKILSSIIANLADYIPEDEIRATLEKILGDFASFSNRINEQTEAQLHFWNNKRIAAMKDGNAKINAQIEEDLRHEKVLYGDNEEHMAILQAEANRKRLNQQEKYNEQAKNKSKQHAREVEAAEKELNSLRIQNMQDGLAKQIALLNEEKREKLAKIKTNGIKVGELTAETEKLYEKKILEAKEEWAYKIEQVYINMWNKIYQINHQNAQMDFDNQLKDLESQYQKLQDVAANNSGSANQDYSSQGVIVTKTPKSKSKAGSTDSSDYNYEVLLEKELDYTKRLREEFATRTEDRKKYYAEIQRLSIEEINKQYEIESKKAAENRNNELRNLQNSYKAQDHELEQHLKNGEITQAQYNEAVKRLEKERAEQEAQIQIKYDTEAEQREREHQNKIVQAKTQANTAILNNYKDMMSKLAAVDSSEVVRNGIGFMNITETRRRNKELIDAYRQLSNDIAAEMKNLENKLNIEDLTKEQREQIQDLIKEYQNLQVAIGQTMVNIQNNSKQATQDFMNECNMYFQEFANTLQTVLQSIWDSQDAAYEKEMEELDKTIDAVKEKYSEMDELAQEHASNMESLEDKIASAQGDARDHLLERYQAEKEAQKQALSEKKKAEKEEQKLQAKKEKMEIEQKKREKKRALVQAAINTAMAISMAAVNSWPMPAIAMMAAAAVAGAAQIAAIASQHYAHGGQLDGGVAQGKRHRDGGIKVLGGRAEIEGGEFITNRTTTEKNIDLLEYINTKKKKLDINDLVEFYGGGTVKKNIQSVRTKFADGGVIPTLRDDVNISDRMVQAMEDYSNRPVQVAVVDIIDKTQQVNDVKVMAGLEV